ncbi:MAG: helix-turn-helix domain-containing protein [Vulcanimicrobiota bacterium]
MRSDINSNKIKYQRQLKGLSQKKLAIMMGVTQGAISQLENSEVKPSYKTLQKLADIFDVSLDYLADRTSIENPGLN